MTVRGAAIRLKAEGGESVVKAAREGEVALVQMGEKSAAASDKAVAAADRQVRKLRETALAAAQAETALQRQINAATGVSTGGNARAAVAARTLGAGAEAYERRAAFLKTELDPAGAALDRLNKELAEYDALAKRGLISTHELAKAQGVAQQKYTEATAAIERQGRGLTRNALASRLNLSRQFADVGVTAAMGMNPAMIAIQQGPQILDAWATSAISLRSPLVMLTGLVGSLAAGTAVLGAAWWDAEKRALSLERAATGLGRTAGLTGQELKAAAEAGAEAGGISIKAAETQAAAYVSTGKIGGEVMTGLIALSKDYTAFMGTDAAGATQQLAKAMTEPDKAAREMTRQLGLMDQETLNTIDSLMKQGDRLAAQKILLEELSGAMSGHSDKVGELTSFWDVATKAMSDYWTKFGEYLHTTRDEKIATLEFRRGIVSTDFARDRIDRELFVERFQRDWGAREAAYKAAEGLENKTAQEEQDRLDADKKNRDRASRDSDRARREAERLAREELQRERREQDRASSLDRDVARATNDHDGLRRLEDEERVRRRIRELVDDGVDQEQARLKAQAEATRLEEARGEQSRRETAEIGRQVDLETARLLGEEQGVRRIEDRLDLMRRIEAYQRAGLDLQTATTTAEADQLQITKARAEAQRRIVAEAGLERQLRLAQLAGDEDDIKRLDRRLSIERRAREIEQREGLNRGKGYKIAADEIREETAAAMLGARRGWLRGLLQDVSQGSLAAAFENQMNRATERWLDRLADSLAELNWGGFVKSLLGGGDGGGSGGLKAIFSTLFESPGGHSTGTAFSEGGLKWVGERGPELMRLPRGAEVFEHNRSMQMAGAMGGAAPVVNFGGLTIKNYGSEPVTGRLQQGANGELEAILEPLMDNHMAKRGQDGGLNRALKASPQPRRR